MTSGEDGILSGNQVLADVNAPVTVSGNAVSVIGDSTVVNGAPAPAAAPAHGGSAPAEATGHHRERTGSSAETRSSPT